MRMRNRRRRRLAWPKRWYAANWQLEDAAAHFRAAAALDAKYRDRLLEVAAEYEKNRRFGDAVAIYREFPENAQARERLGALQVEDKDYSGGDSEDLEQAVRTSPTRENRLALADAYRIAGDHEKAIAQLQAAVAAALPISTCTR